MNHDVTLCQANSIELKKYGIELGLSNYAAAYATGLLVARRFLTKLNLAEVFDNQNDEEEDARRPFKVILDAGIARTTTGAKVFAVMKGAADGGLNVPHEDKRLAGGEDEKKQQFYIMGGHVAAYMKNLQKKDEKAYKRQFSRYIAKGITADKIEAMYKKCHEEIRKNPAAPENKKPKIYAPKVAQTKKMSFEEKRKILNERLAAAGLAPRA